MLPLEPMARPTRLPVLTLPTMVLCLLALTAAFASTPASASASARTVRVGTTPHVPHGAHALGALAGGSPLSLSIGLTPRDPAGLAAYARAVVTPGSGVYHQYLTVAEFAQRFGPTGATIAAVRASLAAHGLHADSLSPNHLLLSVHATADDAAQAFSTGFERYRLPSGDTAYANTRSPLVDTSVAGHIQTIAGLQTVIQRHTDAERATRRAAGARGGFGSHASPQAVSAPITP